jgi:hypothetical protein
MVYNINKMKMIKYSWQYFTLQNNINIFIQTELKSNLELFWNEVMVKLDNKQVAAILFKIELGNDNWKTIAPLQKVSNTNFNMLLKTLQLFININGNNYESLEISKIQFQYAILDSDANAEIVKPISNEVTHYKINGYNLPLTTDLTKWGSIISNKNGKVEIVFDEETETVIHVKISSNKQTYKFMIEDKVLLTIVDIFGNNPITFTRTVNDKTIIVST